MVKLLTDKSLAGLGSRKVTKPPSGGIAMLYIQIKKYINNN